jgi:tRNA threonylcarbamoyladenosine biosynthesis protein TsaE
VEWSERCEDVLEENVVRIDLRRGSSENERIITITGAEGL